MIKAATRSPLLTSGVFPVAEQRGVSFFLTTGVFPSQTSGVFPVADQCPVHGRRLVAGQADITRTYYCRPCEVPAPTRGVSTCVEIRCNKACLINQRNTLHGTIYT